MFGIATMLVLNIKPSAQGPRRLRTAVIIQPEAVIDAHAPPRMTASVDPSAAYKPADAERACSRRRSPAEQCQLDVR